MERVLGFAALFKTYLVPSRRSHTIAQSYQSSRDFVILLFLASYKCGPISKIWSRYKKQSILISRKRKIFLLGLRSVRKTLDYCSIVDGFLRNRFRQTCHSCGPANPACKRTSHVSRRYERLTSYLSIKKAQLKYLGNPYLRHAQRDGCL